MATTIAAEIKAMKGEDVTDDILGLINQGYRVVGAHEWWSGGNYGGERSERVGFVIKFIKEA